MQGWPSGDGNGFVIRLFIDTSVRVRYPAQLILITNIIKHV